MCIQMLYYSILCMLNETNNPIHSLYFFFLLFTFTTVTDVLRQLHRFYLSEYCKTLCIATLFVLDTFLSLHKELCCFMFVASTHTSHFSSVLIMKMKMCLWHMNIAVNLFLMSCLYYWNLQSYDYFPVSWSMVWNVVRL